MSNFSGVDQVPELHGTCVATGRELHAAYTDDDGTCALHSVWGGPVRTTTATVLHCTQARMRIVGGIVEEGQQLVDDHAGGLWRELLHTTSRDMLNYGCKQVQKQRDSVNESRGVAVLWEKLTAAEQQQVSECAMMKLASDADRQSLTESLDKTCAELFIEKNKEEVRRLCIHLGYVSPQDARRRRR